MGDLCNCDYFLLHNFMGNPVNLSIMLKYLFRYLLKLLLLFFYLKHNAITDHFKKRLGWNGNVPYVSNLIVINTKKLQRNLKWFVNYYLYYKTCWRIILSVLKVSLICVVH